jgi:2-iminobutanoate/2-iminopropanoate deaminase
MQTILTEKAPIPAGHYSQAIVHHDVVYIAGQLPIVPGRQDRQVGSIEAQTRQTLANLDAILQAAGSSRDRVLRVTVYVSDVKLWPSVNAEYAAFFGDHRPARTVVPVGKLHYGFDIELDAIAAIK